MGPKSYDRTRLVGLLRAVADLIEENSPETLDDLLSGRVRLRFEPATPQRKQPTRPRTQERDQRTWSNVAERLRELRTRDEGEKFLNGLVSTKADLENLARAMDLPVSKQDNSERLREKIIESSIGSRLVSRAIRGDLDRIDDK